MIYYNGQLKNYKFNTVIRTVKKKRVKKCLDIFSFDIEVTSAWMIPGRGLICYEPGHDADYWNDADKYALPYVWQFSVNDTVYYGRELESFKQLLNDIPKDMHIIIFVHNLAYEFQFLLNIMTVQDVFARAPHKPMKCSFKEYPAFEFRCSYILTNLSLASWGEQLGLPKLVGELDYNMMRTPDTPLFDYELDYCERDCQVVYLGILDHLKSYKDVWDIPITSTGKVRRVVKKMVTNDKDYMRGVKRTIPKDAREYKRLQTVFAGGYTHANRRFIDKIIDGPVHHYDIASSYPFAMCAFKYPYNKWCYIGRQLPDPETFDRRAYMINLHMTGVLCKSWNTYISASKCHGSGFIYDNGRILGADDLYILVTEQDYNVILNTYKYDSLESLGTYCNTKRYLPKIYIEYILQLYNDKTALKGIEDPVIKEQYDQSKRYINSLYGMCVTALFQEDVIFNQDDPEAWSIGALTADKVNAALDKMRIWYNKKYFLSYSAGCWVTAYARSARLWSLIQHCDDDLIYTDTDSIFYTGKYSWEWFNESADQMLFDMCKYYDLDFELTRPKDKKGVKHPLGHLDQEPDADQFKTLGAKKYVERRDDRLYITVAGVNKGAYKALDDDIDKFADGFIFDKDHDDVHKLEHTYLSDMPPIVWPGGYKSEFRYGINMRPTGYKLSKPNVYQDAIDVLNQGYIEFSEYFLSKKRGYFREEI